MARPNPRQNGQRRTVEYRNVDGTHMAAVVTGGSGSSLNLYVPHLPIAQRNKTAVAKRTNMTQTGVWF